MLDTVTFVGLTLRDWGWILSGILVFGGLAWAVCRWIEKTLAGMGRAIGATDERDEHERHPGI